MVLFHTVGFFDGIKTYLEERRHSSSEHASNNYSSVLMCHLNKLTTAQYQHECGTFSGEIATFPEEKQPFNARKLLQIKKEIWFFQKKKIHSHQKI